MPKPNKTNLRERVRLNLEFPPQIYDQMQEVQHRSHAASLTEVLRRALALYDLVTEHTVDGGDIVLVDSKGKQEKLRIL
ncbi:MAG: hypothetical protein ACLPRE_08590 [Limisphaerales bacterium]